MNAPINHKAKIVEELQNRLSEAMNDEDADFLAKQLTEAGDDLEAACVAILREGRARKAMAEGLDSVIDDAKARKERLLEWDKKARAMVGQAMGDAGLPKIVSADLTVSFRMGKSPLIIDGEPGEGDVLMGWATVKHVFSWDKDRLRKDLSEEADIPFARFGNPCPQIVVRSK